MFEDMLGQRQSRESQDLQDLVFRIDIVFVCLQLTSRFVSDHECDRLRLSNSIIEGTPGRGKEGLEGDLWSRHSPFVGSHSG